MKRLLYTLFIGVITSTIFLVIPYNEKYRNLQLDSNKKSTYCLNELCRDLISLNYDFSVTKYKHKLFLSANSKEIKIGPESIYVYIYENQDLVDKDANKFLEHSEEAQSLLYSDENLSSFYKKGRLIVQYNGHDENIKNSLDSILVLAFLEAS